MNFYQDTIVAQSTAPGKGAIHIIRISGEDAISVCDRIFRGHKFLKDTYSRYSSFGRIFDGDQLIDEVLAIVFRAPDSYTGEDLVEISCHGSQYIADLILALLLRYIRLAEPGEFTQRAFINNKLDLTQAEAVGDLLAASTKHSHAIAVNQLEGKLKKKIKACLDIITDLRLKLELEIDFPEDFVESISYEELVEKVNLLSKELEILVASGRDGMILRMGCKVCLVGKPNVGKSSIFNAFLESERAIVTPVPGTTRDYLEEAISLEGFLIIFYDTAGLRETENQIEMLGMKRSLEIINRSDLVIYITDSLQGDDDLSHLEASVENYNIIKTINKTDILDMEVITDYVNKGFIPCSTISPDGLNALKSHLITRININPEKLDYPPLTNVRQIAAANKALSELERVHQALEQGASIEFIAFDLQQVSQALEEITGMITTEEILDKIFSNFCLGK